MSIAKVYSAQLVGLRSEIITIEVDISNGLHSFAVVGLGDRAVEEARDRIAAAIKNSGYVSPKQKNQKIVISLAPADMRKEGPSFDLAMAIAYLAAAGDADFDPRGTLFLGELSLEGKVRKVFGVLPLLCQAREQGFTRAFVPHENSAEASLAREICVYGVSTLVETLDHITGKASLPVIKSAYAGGRTWPPTDNDLAPDISDMALIRGNASAKRGLEIAAAGGHNVIMCGPPGTGKTMLAQSFRSILPRLSYEESIEVTSIHSAARALNAGLIIRPPFRAPHHTASYASIIGGQGYPRPGEITLAHRGVLFMDEFPQFERDVIEALRQPLEERTVTIARARGTITFPAQCILIASMNPCPCGKGKNRGCICPQKIVEAYRRRISGPILDRIDIWASVSAIDYEKLAQPALGIETSEVIRGRVDAARARQLGRFQRAGLNIRYNSEMGARELDLYLHMEDEARAVLTASAARFNLSGRAFHRIMKVARTIADLERADVVSKTHVLEALQYREKRDE